MPRFFSSFVPTSSFDHALPPYPRIAETPASFPNVSRVASAAFGPATRTAKPPTHNATSIGIFAVWGCGMHTCQNKLSKHHSHCHSLIFFTSFYLGVQQQTLRCLFIQAYIWSVPFSRRVNALRLGWTYLLSCYST